MARVTSAERRDRGIATQAVGDAAERGETNGPGAVGKTGRGHESERTMSVHDLTGGPFGPSIIGNPEWITLPVARRARLTGIAGGLSGIPLNVFVVMAENANAAGRGFRLSKRSLALESGFSLAAIRRTVVQLEAGDWIRCTHKSPGGLKPSGMANPTSVYSILTLRDRPGDMLKKSQRTATLRPENRLLRTVASRNGVNGGISG